MSKIVALLYILGLTFGLVPLFAGARVIIDNIIDRQYFKAIIQLVVMLAMSMVYAVALVTLMRGERFVL